MKTTAYEIEIIPDLIRYRVRFSTDKGQVLSFTVQLENKGSGVWDPVVRYDTAHGFAHRDRYSRVGTVVRHEVLPKSGYNEAMDYAIRDVKLNWEQWLEEFGGMN